MMRVMKCSYCKYNLAYVSKMQTINHLEPRRIAEFIAE